MWAIRTYLDSRYAGRLSHARAAPSFFLAAVGGVSAAAAPARPLDAVKSSGVLRVTVYHDYKPCPGRRTGAARASMSRSARRSPRRSASSPTISCCAPTTTQRRSAQRRLARHPPRRGAGRRDVACALRQRVEEANDKIKLTAPYQIEGWRWRSIPTRRMRRRISRCSKPRRSPSISAPLPDIILLSARDHKLISNVVHVHGEGKAAKHSKRARSSPSTANRRWSRSWRTRRGKPVSIVYPPHRLAQTWPLGGAVKARFHRSRRRHRQARSHRMAAVRRIEDRFLRPTASSWRPPGGKNDDRLTVLARRRKRRRAQSNCVGEAGRMSLGGMGMMKRTLLAGVSVLGDGLRPAPVRRRVTDADLLNDGDNTEAGRHQRPGPAGRTASAR